MTMMDEALQKHIGQRIRGRRIQLGLTQTHLADKLGISFQQAHKYEKGASGISATRLFSLAVLLQVDVNYFYNNLLPSLAEVEKQPSHGARANLEVARNFQRIPDHKCREALSLLCKAIADDYPHQDF